MKSGFACLPVLNAFCGKNVFSFRFCSLVCALVLYGIVSFPTPDTPGWPEFFIGVFLIFSVVSPFLVRDINKNTSVCLLFIYGLSIPLLMGVFQNAEIAFVFRDLIAFLFLCLPVLIVPLLKENEDRQRLFFFILLFIGICFSSRALMEHYGLVTMPAELMYLPNSSLVLMALLFFLTMSFQTLYIRLNNAAFLQSACYLVLTTLMFSAVLIDTQRAVIGVSLMTLLLFFVAGLFRAPKRIIAPLGLVFLLLFLGWPWLSDVLHLTLTKTAQVGFNMRFQELNVVLSAVSASPVTFLFGYGWGASYESPAVGSLDVTYTHSLLTYMLFKTGLCGLCLTLLYLGALFVRAFSVVRQNVLAAAIVFWPIVIPVFLYASYKSLDFGLMLTLAALWIRDPQILHPGALYSSDLKSTSHLKA